MSVKMSLPMITRRTFLKASAATAAVVAVGDTLLGGRSSLVSNAKAAAPKEDAWYPGVCKMCMQGDCQQRVHVVDGVVVKMEGDPRAVQNVGTLCPRGNSSIMHMYDPWRIKSPLKRTNPNKGLNEDPKFVEITWDEALQTVADRLKKNIADDTRKIAFVSGFGVRSQFLGNFETAIGTVTDTPSRGSACAYHLGGYMSNQNGPDNVPDIERVEYILNIARTLGPNIATGSVGTRNTMDALVNRGVKIVNVDPRCGPEASKMDWLPIRPGTELAFLLAILHTILYEIKVYDVWSVKNRTNGPYLIADGEYVRDPDSKKPLMWNSKLNQAVPFDDPNTADLALEGTFDVNGVTATPALQLIKDAMKTYTAEWQEPISTVPAAKIREIANDLVTHAHIGATVTIDGVTMPFRPVSIQYEKGAYAHVIEGPFGDFTGKIICMLLGNLEVPGGQSGNSMPGKAWLQPDADGVRVPGGEGGADYYGYKWTWPLSFADLRQFYPVSHTLIWGLAKNILDPQKYHSDFALDMLVTCGGGPVRSSFDRTMFEQAWSKVPFHVAFSMIYDENAMLADIVLADCSYPEKDQLHAGSGSPPGHKVMVDSTRGAVFFLWRDASKITPPYNARSADSVLIDLAEKAGILTGKNGLVDVINRNLKSFPLDNTKKPTLRQVAEATLKQNLGAQYTLADVDMAHGPMYTYSTRGAKNYNYSYWPNNKTRHPIYFIQLPRAAKRLRENMKAAGITDIPGWETNQAEYWQEYAPIPSWIPCHEFNAPAEYDLWAINWKTPMAPFYCGNTFGNVWLHETMSTFDPYEYAIWLNSKTAEKKGIKDGDTIVVESRYGKTQGRVKVTELIHPDVVGFPSGHGAASPMANPITAEGAYFNALCNLDEKNLAVDPLTAQVEEGPAVKVYKA